MRPLPPCCSTLLLAVWVRDAADHQQFTRLPSLPDYVVALAETDVDHIHLVSRAFLEVHSPSARDCHSTGRKRRRP